MITWQNTIYGSRRVAVYVWDDVKSLREHTDEKDAIALCCRLPYFVHSDTGIPIINRIFAEIHVPVTHIGAGIIAHEIQHLILFWIETFGIDVTWSDEYICKITGDVTRRFWTSFYERFEK